MRIKTSALFLAIFVGNASTIAQSKLYLAEYRFNDPKMYRMDLDGGNVEAIVGMPSSDWLLVGLAIDTVNGHLYWLHGSFNQGLIRRADLGLDVSINTLLVAGQTNARGLALDVAGGKMYWADTQDDVIRRANLDGTNIQTIVTGSQTGRPALDLVNGRVYYGDFTQDNIRRADLDGANNEIVISTGVDTAAGIALDIDGGKFYWVDSQTITNYIARANLDGSGFEVLIDYPTASSGLVNIELDIAGGKMYWADEITAEEKGVWRANLDGSDPQMIWSSPVGWNAGAIAIVLDDAACEPADANCDGAVTLADLAPFVDALLGSPSGCSPCQADTNGDGSVNGLDADGFISAILGP